MKKDPKFVLERDYYGYELYTDGAKFFAETNGNSPRIEGPSLDAVKTKVRGQGEKEFDLPGVLFDRYGWRDEDEGKEVKITGVTASKKIRYQFDGKRDATDNCNVRVIDRPDRFEEYRRLLGAHKAAEKAFHDFNTEWRETSEKLLGIK